MNLKMRLARLEAGTKQEGLLVILAGAIDLHAKVALARKQRRPVVVLIDTDINL